MKPNNVLSFFSRYWRLFVLFVVSILLTIPESIFGVFGTIVYLPALLSGAVLAALIVIHWKWPETIDADNHSGFFVTSWQALPPSHRVYLNLGMTGLLIYCATHIAAALIK
jgi:hypothetical protein